MVEPETFTFLADLARNNRKAWMDEHREERDDALRNFTGIAITLHDYADRFDPYVADAKIKPKQSYSRFFQEARDRVGPGLYRTDVDVFANAGNPAEDVGYYLHIEPGNCHAGAGLFQLSTPEQNCANAPERKCATWLDLAGLKLRHFVGFRFVHRPARRSAPTERRSCAGLWSNRSGVSAL